MVHNSTKKPRKNLFSLRILYCSTSPQWTKGSVRRVRLAVEIDLKLKKKIKKLKLKLLYLHCVWRSCSC